MPLATDIGISEYFSDGRARGENEAGKRLVIIHCVRSVQREIEDDIINSQMSLNSSCTSEIRGVRMDNEDEVCVRGGWGRWREQY